MTAWRMYSRLMVIAFLALLMPACGGGKRIAQANRTLRTENLELKKQVETLSKRNSELETELESSSHPPSTMPEEIRANTPHVTSISVGRLTHAQDSDGDGRVDVVLVYVQPTDGLGRFVQMVGTISVNAAVLPAHANAATIGRAQFSPSQVRQAYRSSITGVHYTLEVPIQMPQGQSLDEAAQKVVIAVVYNDGLTGRSFSAERSVSLK